MNENHWMLDKRRVWCINQRNREQIELCGTNQWPTSMLWQPINCFPSSRQESRDKMMSMRGTKACWQSETNH